VLPRLTLQTQFIFFQTSILAVSETKVIWIRKKMVAIGEREKRNQ
jgi:hypothetical protein